MKMKYKSRKICKNKEYIYCLLANIVTFHLFIHCKYEIALDLTFNVHL